MIKANVYKVSCLIASLGAVFGLYTSNCFSSDASLPDQAAKTFVQITESLQASQHEDGAWAGVVDSDTSFDLMPVVLMKNLGLSHPGLMEETLERIYRQQNPDTGLWSAYPGGPASMDATGAILYGLKYIGIESDDPRVARAWAWFSSNNGSPYSLSVGHRMAGAMGGWLPANVSFPIIAKVLGVPSYFPVNMNTLGVERIGIIPYAIWRFYRTAKLKNRKVKPLDPKRLESKGNQIAGSLFKTVFEPTEYWAQEGIGWILDHQQKDGTWAGALHMVYYNLIALHEAQLAGVGNFDAQIQKAWEGLMSWRARIPEGSIIQQSTVGPVMDTARILSAIKAAPAPVASLALPEEYRTKAALWLLDHQITDKKGDWSKLVPNVAPGGWTFEYSNDFYPDCDDTAMVLEALAKSDLSSFPKTGDAILKGLTWLLAIQNRDGGFPAWDRGVTPLLKIGLKITKMPEISDDSQIDITSRSIKGMVALVERFPDSSMPALVKKPIKKACRFIKKQAKRTKNSSLPLWRGDWMADYLYGTSEAISGLLAGHCLSVEESYPYIEWLRSQQHQDGGWGESPESFVQNTYVDATSTLSQTDWVLNTLIFYERLRLQTGSRAPSVMSAIEHGVRFLINRIGDQKNPYEKEFTGTFVRGVWYVRYVSLAHYEAIRALGGYLSLAESSVQ